MLECIEGGGVGRGGLVADEVDCHGDGRGNDPYREEWPVSADREQDRASPPHGYAGAEGVTCEYSGDDCEAEVFSGESYAGEREDGEDHAEQGHGDGDVESPHPNVVLAVGKHEEAGEWDEPVVLGREFFADDARDDEEGDDGEGDAEGEFEAEGPVGPCGDRNGEEIGEEDAVFIDECPAVGDGESVFDGVDDEGDLVPGVPVGAVVAPQRGEDGADEDGGGGEGVCGFGVHCRAR